MTTDGRPDLRSLTTESSTAQIFAALLGILFVISGAAALITGFNFSVGSNIVTSRLLFADVNGWSGLLLLVSGLLLLTGARSAGAARRASLLVGGFWLLVTLWSLFTSTVFWLLPVNDLTAIVFAAVAVLGITAALAPDPREHGPRKAATGSPAGSEQ